MTSWLPSLIPIIINVLIQRQMIEIFLLLKRSYKIISKCMSSDESCTFVQFVSFFLYFSLFNNFNAGYNSLLTWTNLFLRHWHMLCLNRYTYFYFLYFWILFGVENLIKYYLKENTDFYICIAWKELLSLNALS